VAPAIRTPCRGRAAGEIGHLSDLSGQRVNQALKALARLVEVAYGGIVVLDLPGLRNFGG
jgi:hypothetical protein